MNSCIQAMVARNIKAVAPHVIPRKVLPLYAAIPTLSPYLLIAFTTFTMMAVAIAEAIANAINAS